jgi:hypothetical protein
MARAPRFPLREDVQEHALRRAIGAEAGDFQQRVPSLRPREGIARAADVLEDEVEHDTRHELEGGQVGAGRGLGRREKVQGRGELRQGDERGCRFGGLRIEAQGGGRDDAQRALRADQHVFQSVAAVILLERAQAGQHAAVGQHHLQAQHQLARRAVGQHADPAGVAGEGAADLTACLRGQAQGNSRPAAAAATWASAKLTPASSVML